MTNTIRGTVSREIDGERYNFRLSANEWCELEDEFGKRTDELLKEFFAMVGAAQLDMRILRSYFRAAMSSDGGSVSHADAGRLMAAMGLTDAAALLGEVIVLSMPEHKPEPKGGAVTGKPARAKKASA